MIKSKFLNGLLSSSTSSQTLSKSISSFSNVAVTLFFWQSHTQTTLTQILILTARQPELSSPHSFICIPQYISDPALPRSLLNREHDVVKTQALESDSSDYDSTLATY